MKISQIQLIRNRTIAEAPTHLQSHHALLVEPHFGRGVPGAAQKCPELPRRQRANCENTTKITKAGTT